MLNNLFKCTRSIIKVLFIKTLIEQVQRAKEFYLKLRSIWKNASEEMRLKKCI